jgi:hypothetical protein
MTLPSDNPKICLSCARRALAKQPPQPCGSCVILNVDPLAEVRARAAKPSPLAGFMSSTAVVYGGVQGTVVERGQRAPSPTSCERGE